MKSDSIIVTTTENTKTGSGSTITVMLVSIIKSIKTRLGDIKRNMHRLIRIQYYPLRRDGWQNNKEKVRLTRQRSYYRDKEQIRKQKLRQYKRDYYQNHKDKLRVLHRQYEINHKEQIAASRRKYYYSRTHQLYLKRNRDRINFNRRRKKKMLLQQLPDSK